MEQERTFTAFSGHIRIAAGDLMAMLTATKKYLDRGGDDQMLIFDDQTGRQVDFDFRGTIAEVLERAGQSPARSGPGRPKLGVVAREVTLLPRQWEWLESQRGGISAALRRLVDEARKREPDRQRARRLRDAAGTLMWNLAGDLENFEEASRALYAGDNARFAELISNWPIDVRDHLQGLVQDIALLERDESPAATAGRPTS